MQSVSVRNRINIGFAALTLVTVLISVLSYGTVSTLGEGYERYRTTAQQTIAINDYVEDLFQARIAAFAYRVNPNDAAVEDVRGNIDEILTGVQNNSIFETSPNVQSGVAEVAENAVRYRDAFLRLNNLQMNLTANEAGILATGHQARGHLTELRALASDNSEVWLLRQQSEIQENMLLGQIYAEAFIRSNTQQKFENSVQFYSKAITQLKNAKAFVTTLGDPSWSGDAEVLIVSTEEAIQDVLERVTLSQTILRDLTAVRTGELDVVGPMMQDRLETAVDSIVAEQNELGSLGQASVEQSLFRTPIEGALATAFAILIAFVLGRWVTVPLQNLAHTTEELAKGNTNLEIVGAEHNHELGKMAKSLDQFKQAHIEREREKELAQQAKMEQQSVVSALSEGLTELAKGRLDHRVTQDFPAEYHLLKDNYNAALDTLSDTMSNVVDVSRTIDSSANDISDGSYKLSQRTENQAATLEETAAAIEELTASVSNSANRATDVEKTVESARADARESGSVVTKAIEAMSEIKASSEQISQITGVLSDIAFQTNLLALNAGVEAARAGEAGRGFAVVASEVRSLAQRSSESAQEVSELIVKSSTEVAQGTKLVSAAGNALNDIIERIEAISQLISEIASGTVEQASSLSEVNVGVRQLDNVTQQNAGMVETSRDQSFQMQSEAARLQELVKNFRLAKTRATTLQSKTRQREAS